MDEHLVGYLLKALDPDEQLAVEAHLEAHPDARAKMELLERALTPLAADAEEPEVPAGLALATFARIAEHNCRPAAEPVVSPPRLQLAPSGWPRIRRADVLAAAALLLIVSGLMLPVLARARQERDRVGCAENLRTIWGALSTYSEQSDGNFPKIAADGPKSVAGAFLPMLHDAGALPGVTLVACPARADRVSPADVTMDGLSEALSQNNGQFEQLARVLSGGYAYTLGYHNGNSLVGLRADDPDTLPIVADLPASNGNGDSNSPNHGGGGQNVLYIGGNVRWCNVRTVGEDCDDIYVNRKFLLGAGEGRSDTVLGPGDARPTGGSE